VLEVADAAGEQHHPGDGQLDLGLSAGGREGGYEGEEEGEREQCAALLAGQPG
jgi:hypothetical protein